MKRRALYSQALGRTVWDDEPEFEELDRAAQGTPSAADDKRIQVGEDIAFASHQYDPREILEDGCPVPATPDGRPIFRSKRAVDEFVAWRRHNYPAEEHAAYERRPPVETPRMREKRR